MSGRRDSLRSFVTDKVLLVILLVPIIGIGYAAYLSYQPMIDPLLQSPPEDRFTEFYLLGPSGLADGYPTNMTLGENGTVLLGIVNHEYANVTYSVDIIFDNVTLLTLDAIELAHDAAWQQNITFTPDHTGTGKLEFNLYRETVANPYRRLHLWITVHEDE